MAFLVVYDQIVLYQIPLWLTMALWWPVKMLSWTAAQAGCVQVLLTPSFPPPPPPLFWRSFQCVFVNVDLWSMCCSIIQHLGPPPSVPVRCQYKLLHPFSHDPLQVSVVLHYSTFSWHSTYSTPFYCCWERPRANGLVPSAVKWFLIIKWEKPGSFMCQTVF